MYVCMYVCMYVYMFVCMYVCMYVRTYVRTYVCMYVCTCMYVYMFVCGVCVYYYIVLQDEIRPEDFVAPRMLKKYKAKIVSVFVMHNWTIPSTAHYSQSLVL